MAPTPPASLLPPLQRPVTRLLAFGLSAVLAVYLGFIGLDVEAAGSVVKHAGYYFLLSAFGLWVVALARLWRERLPGSTVCRRELAVAAGVIGGLTLIAVNAEPFRSKVLYDEFVLQSTAFNMHFFRDTVTMVRGYEIGGVFLSLDNYLDKRPNFYPFLISLVHDLTGYRTANAYALNAALYPITLALAYYLGRRLQGALGGLLAVLLLGSLPLLGQNATGSGMELLNFGMILAVAGLGGAYLRRPDETRLSALVLGAVLLAQSRYESALYVLPVALVIMLGWWREQKVILSWAVVPAPLLLLPSALQNKVLNNTRWMWELKVDQESRFSTDYLAGNLQGVRGFLFNDTPMFANSVALSVLGLAGLAWVAWRLARLWRRPAGWASDHTALVLLGLAASGNTVLILFYYWSNFTDPMAARFSLPLHFVFVFAVVAAAAGLARRWPSLPKGLVALACVALAVATGRFAQSLYSHTGIDEIEWERRFVAARPEGPRMIITNKSTLPWLLDQTPAILVGRAGMMSDRLKFHLDAGTFREVLVTQSFRPSDVDGRHQLTPGDVMPAGFKLEPIAERRFGTKINRISRLVALELPAAEADAKHVAAR
jgi:hypothetical protein